MKKIAESLKVFSFAVLLSCLAFLSSCGSEQEESASGESTEETTAPEVAPEQPETDVEEADSAATDEPTEDTVAVAEPQEKPETMAAKPVEKKTTTKTTEPAPVEKKEVTTTEEPAEEEETSEPAGQPKMKFAEKEYDFGEILQGDVVEKTFAFTNTGSAPLVISNARASCGCTVPSYPKEPVAPGAEGKIDVKFNSRGKSGTQRKSITITTNGGTEVVYLTGKVNLPESK